MFYKSFHYCEYQTLQLFTKKYNQRSLSSKRGQRKVRYPLQHWERIHSKQEICSMLCFATIKEIVRLWQGIYRLLYIPLETWSSFQLLLKILLRLSYSPEICVHKTSVGNVLKLKNNHPSFQYHLQLSNLIFFEDSMSSFHVFLQVPIVLLLTSFIDPMDYVKPTATTRN